MLWGLFLFVAAAVAFQEAVLAGSRLGYFVVGCACLLSSFATPAIVRAVTRARRWGRALPRDRNGDPS